MKKEIKERKNLRKVGASKLPEIVFLKSAYKAFISARSRLGYWTLRNIKERDKKVLLKVKQFLEDNSFTINFDFLEDYFYGVMFLTNKERQNYRSIFYDKNALEKFSDYSKRKNSEDLKALYDYSMIELYNLLKANKIFISDKEGIKNILLAGNKTSFYEVYIEDHPLVTGKKRTGETLKIWKKSFTQLAVKYSGFSKYRKVM